MTAAGTTLLVGGYGSRAGGRADGIRAVTLQRSGLLTGGETVLRTESPSFVRTHPWLPVVYAVNETDGRFGAHRVVGRGLEEVATWDVGASPCHIAVDPRGRWAVVSCWGDGAVVFLPLDASGLPGEPQPGPPAVAPAGNPSRAHAAAVVGEQVLTTDAGLDLVRVWERTAAGPALSSEVTVPGHPRHLAVHPDGSVFVLTEATARLAILRPGDDGRYGLADLVPCLEAPAVELAGAELVLTHGGRTIVAGVRGPDVLVTFRYTSSAGPERVGVTPSGGAWPRHHAVIGDVVVVANQHSDRLTSFSLDARGRLSGPVSHLTVPTPTAVTPAPTPWPEAPGGLLHRLRPARRLLQRGP